MDNHDELHKYVLEQIEYYINEKGDNLRQADDQSLYLWLASNKYYQSYIKLEEHQVLTIVSQMRKLNYDEIACGLLKFEQLMHQANKITGTGVYTLALNIFIECELIRTIQSVIKIRKENNRNIRPKHKIFQVINTVMGPFNLSSVNLLTKIKRSTIVTVNRKILDK